MRVQPTWPTTCGGSSQTGRSRRAGWASASALRWARRNPALAALGLTTIVLALVAAYFVRLYVVGPGRGREIPGPAPPGAFDVPPGASPPRHPGPEPGPFPREFRPRRPDFEPGFPPPPPRRRENRKDDERFPAR